MKILSRNEYNKKGINIHQTSIPIDSFKNRKTKYTQKRNKQLFLGSFLVRGI